ncbi:hypothetical protein QE327_gp091 [Pseudomonas phage Henu5]|uniref:Uncharacterized protein n=1 Tax=Pseudomonas phage Henu5 TaxID=2499902 RepID=A0A410T8G6_9CAUD|nr:hypothetical protein QE327_gp091 [Pseudomonas phage Henu5]QAU05125.1 hypothetical protein Henu5_gp95 [Pseudomonas phage Henu5]
MIAVAGEVLLLEVAIGATEDVIRFFTVRFCAAVPLVVVNCSRRHSLHLDSGLLEGFFHGIKHCVVAADYQVAVDVSCGLHFLRQLHPQSRAAGLPYPPVMMWCVVDVLMRRMLISIKGEAMVPILNLGRVVTHEPRFKLVSHTPQSS